MRTEYEILLMLDPDVPEERQNEIVERTRELVERERRHLGPARAVGAAEARLRDRPQGRGRVPPARADRGAGGARRGLARAEDHRRRGAAPGGPAHRARSRPAGSADAARWAGCRPSPSPLRRRRREHGEHQPGRPRRKPHARPRAAAHAERHGRVQAAPGGEHAARRTRRPASGARSRTTSTSPSGATRARTARSSSPRAGRWRSTAGWTGASGKRRTARSARRSRSSPTRVQFLGSREGGGEGGERQFVPAGRRAGRRLPARGRRRRHPLLAR